MEKGYSSKFKYILFDKIKSQGELFFEKLAQDLEAMISSGLGTSMLPSGVISSLGIVARIEYDAFDSGFAFIEFEFSTYFDTDISSEDLKEELLRHLKELITIQSCSFNYINKYNDLYMSVLSSEETKLHIDDILKEFIKQPLKISCYFV